MTNLVIEHFVRKPFHVHGVEVTEENMAALALWCGGTVKTAREGEYRAGERYIYVPVDTKNERLKHAFIGDFVTNAKGFKVYTKEAMSKTFDKASELEPA